SSKAAPSAAPGTTARFSFKTPSTGSKFTISINFLPHLPQSTKPSRNAIGSRVISPTSAATIGSPRHTQTTSPLQTHFRWQPSASTPSPFSALHHHKNRHTKPASPLSRSRSHRNNTSNNSVRHSNIFLPATPTS